ncbi:MAG TPA: hypothetical protein VMJ10_13530 [Kofleriaceae bacterium]|nr:hypothetical protein [Kofleriaceae bacterium]
MPSRLSSLLVRDGLVGVKRMEKAFQRQVIYGGSLDTILLEMNLVPEERLVQYLALASGLPPASKDDGAMIGPEPIKLIAPEIAEQFRAVPLSLDGEALRVLVCSPIEIEELEDLADLLDRPLQPLIAPEYRWHLVYARAYGLDVPARYETLAAQVSADATPAPVGRARSVIVDGPAEIIAPEPSRTLPLVPAIPRLPAKQAPQLGGIEATAPLVAAQLRPAPPILPVGPVAPLTPVVAPVTTDEPTIKVTFVDPALGSGEVRAKHGTLLGHTPHAATMTVNPRRSLAGTETPSTGIPRALTDSARAKMASARVPKRDSAPIVTAGRDSPLAIVPARELLANAEDRDTVFLTLLRATRSRARYAGLLTVQGGAAVGRVALAEPGIDTAGIARVLIPLDAMSPFRAVVHNQQPHIGALTSGDPSVDTMILRLGGTLPPSALVMPIVLRGRVVALVVAHRVHSDLKLVDVTELLPLAAGAADALGRLIVKHKAAGYRAPAAPDERTPKIVIDGDGIDTKKIVKPEAEWRAPAPAERPSLPSFEDDAELSITTEPPRTIEEVIDEIEASKEGQADDAIADAVERASETLGVLVKRFPGKLRVERFAVTGRTLRAAQYGGLLELVVALGAAAAELLVDKMSAPQRDVRFYATICAVELRPRNAVFALVERVFDQDFGVRAAAIEALAGYPAADRTQALARARRAVHSTDPEVVAAACAAIVELGDVEAIGDLVGALERSDRGTDNVRKALVALTAQDFGTSERKWRKWYDSARKRHRIEWLIDGLSHKEDAIRERAIDDLRRLTGEYFGYHHDLPRKEREQAAERWVAWWRETGQRRFVQREDERARPTAMLPVRRD